MSATSTSSKPKARKPRAAKPKTAPATVDPQVQAEVNAAIDATVRPQKKIAIVGFTGSRDKAPWGDPEWEIWICNNLWKIVPEQWHVLFDLHDNATITSDPEHAGFLAGQDGMRPDNQTRVNLNGRPVVTWKPLPEWPTAVAYPKDPTVDHFGTYFTNSISWMIAAAIAAGASEIGVFGVDMATNTEYGAQRPSCEFYLGWAAGLGIKLHIPDESDLCKVAYMYGAEDDSPLRAKLEDRRQELAQRKAQAEQQLNSLQIQHAQLTGAYDNTVYFANVWLSPHANRDGTPKAAADAASESKVAA